MPTSYPGGIDSFVDPLAANTLDNPPHATQHSDLNGAVEAIETELGTNPSGAAATVAARFTADETALTDHGAAADPHTVYQLEAQKGAASGYASLDGTTKVPIAQLPTGTTSTTVALGDAPAGAVTTHAAAADPHPVYAVHEARAKLGTLYALIPDGGYAVSSGTQTAGRLYYQPITLRRSVTVDQLLIEVTTAGAGGTVARMGIYNADTDFQPTSLVVDAGTVATDSLGVKSITLGAPQVLAAGNYLLALHPNGTPTLRFVTVPSAPVSTLGVGPFVSALFIDTAYAVLANPGVAWTNLAQSTTGFGARVFARISVP